jgi:PadR family transcriptional regulator PadR
VKAQGKRVALVPPQAQENGDTLAVWMEGAGKPNRFWVRTIEGHIAVRSEEYAVNCTRSWIVAVATAIADCARSAFCLHIQTSTGSHLPMPSPNARGALGPGMLEMLLLKTLDAATLHGYAIAQHIQRLSHDVLSIEQGSLYPALERLQARGWVTSRWGSTPTGRQARYYTITASGRKQLGNKQVEYDRVAAAIARVMRSA